MRCCVRHKLRTVSELVKLPAFVLQGLFSRITADNSTFASNDGVMIMQGCWDSISKDQIQLREAEFCDKIHIYIL